MTPMEKVSNKLYAERNYNKTRATCVALSDTTIFIGTSEGHLIIFDLESEEYYATFSDKGKEYQGNSITAIDVHPINTEFVVFGY